MHKIIILIAFLCSAALLNADKIEQQPVSRMKTGQSGSKEQTHPGPDAKEKKQFLGKYSFYLSENDVWNDKVLTILKIEEVPVKDLFPQLNISATMTVPAHWDNTQPVAAGVSFRLFYDEKQKRSLIQKISISITANLSYKDGPQTWIFEGAYLPGLKGFAGTYTLNGTQQGFFAAVKK